MDLFLGFPCLTHMPIFFKLSTHEHQVSLQYRTLTGRFIINLCVNHLFFPFILPPLISTIILYRVGRMLLFSSGSSTEEWVTVDNKPTWEFIRNEKGWEGVVAIYQLRKKVKWVVSACLKEKDCACVQNLTQPFNAWLSHTMYEIVMYGSRSSG